MRDLSSAVLAMIALSGFAASQDAGSDSVVSPTSPAPAARSVPSLVELIAAVRNAHSGGRETPIDRFKAALRVTPVRSEKDVQIDLEATFLAPRFLRFRVEEASEVLEKGWDDRGPWARVGEAVENLSDRRWEKDRNEVRRQVSLARQLIDFLDPSTVLGRFDPSTTPRRDELALGARRLDCDLVVGTVDSFPLFSGPEGATDGRCGLRVWIDATTHLLTAIHATPLDEAGRAVSEGEFLLLQNYKQQLSVAVPNQLLVFRGMPGAAGRLDWKVEIRGIDLAPDGVSIETMRRPTR